jgi:hypothetical protein
VDELELAAELAVVALAGLLDPLEVCGERLLRLPGGAVDALELRPLLVAAPVGAGDALEGEGGHPLRRGDVRAAAQVGPHRAVGPTFS